MTSRIQRADQKSELDRGQWSDLDSVGYKIVTTGAGEAIGGPFYFGRAFDSPPFFTFSAAATTLGVGAGPQLTVGVTEWIRDEQGMYVGANLWFKFGHVNPCLLNYRYGTQLLADPGFEGGYARGPIEGELPVLGDNIGQAARNILWPSNVNNIVEHLGEAKDISQKYPWVQVMPNDLTQPFEFTWRQDTSSSHTGTESVSFDFGALPPTPPFQEFQVSPRLHPVGFTSCSPGVETPVCVEPDPIYSANLLVDAGAESQGGGPDGDEIPEVRPSGPPNTGPPWIMWPSEDNDIDRFSTLVPADISFMHGQVGTEAVRVNWHISTANPRSGSSHLRLTTDGTAHYAELIPISRFKCLPDPVWAPPTSVKSVSGFLSGAAVQGDVVTVSCWLADNITIGTDYEWYVDWFRADGSLISTDGSPPGHPNITAAYALFSHTTAGAPNTTAFFIARLVQDRAGFAEDGDITDADDFSVVVTK